MPDSVSSAFSEPEDFGAAMHAEGCLSFFITGPGEFRARLTQVGLNAMRLSAAEEQLSRIAFVAVPAEAVMIMFPIGKAIAPACAGLRMQVGEFMTLCPGARFYVRSDSPSHWGTIRLPDGHTDRPKGPIFLRAGCETLAPPWRLAGICEAFSHRPSEWQ